MSSDVPVGIYRTYAYPARWGIHLRQLVQERVPGDGHFTAAVPSFTSPPTDTTHRRHHAVAGRRHGGGGSVGAEHLPHPHPGNRAGRPRRCFHGRRQGRAAAGVEGKGRGGRAHLDRRPLRRSRLYQRSSPRWLGKGDIRPHLADLRGLRRRVVDVRPRGRPVHAHPHRRQPELHPPDALPGTRIRHRDPPPRRGPTISPTWSAPSSKPAMRFTAACIDWG